MGYQVAERVYKGFRQEKDRPIWGTKKSVAREVSKVECLVPDID